MRKFFVGQVVFERGRPVLVLGYWDPRIRNTTVMVVGRHCHD